MENTHNITYEGLDLEVNGTFENAELETGYKGGWSYNTILVNGNDISWMLRPEIINHINQIITDENY